MSLYAEYLRERTFDFIIESPTGFVTYRYINDNKSVYALDMYIVPEQRRTGKAREFLEMVIQEGKKTGCSELLGTVLINKPWTTENLKIWLNYGCEVKSVCAEAIILRKDI